jgi:hypothetical protein
VLEGPGGQILLRTPQLSGALACRAMIVNIRLTAMLPDRYDRSTVPGVCAFTLRGPSGSPLATSPLFPNEQARERAIETVRRHAASAPVEHAPIGAVDFVEALQGEPETSGPKSTAHEPRIGDDVGNDLEDSRHDA